ncbi:MAG: hypothetical protein AB1Z19_01730, partial [Eubacteriales bacterium]
KEKKAAPAKQETKGSAKSLRLVAIILWVLAIGAEVLAIWLFNRSIFLIEGKEWQLYAALGLDALLVIIGAQLWKRANRIKPCASKSKFVKMIWDQMGVIVAFLAFIPFGILYIINAKDLPKKTRTVLAVVLAVLFAGTVGASADYNPVSPEEAEEKASAVEEQLAEEGIEYDGVVYWTTYGKSYHLDRDCFTLNRTTEENLHSGTLEEAFEAGRTDPCDFCALPEEEEMADTTEE